MAAPGVLDPEALFQAERRRYLKELQKSDQRLWDSIDMMRKAQDVTYGFKRETNKTFDVSPHIIASAHISTALQGSVVPGTVDPNVRAGRIVLDNGVTIKQEPFNSFTGPPPPGIGDKNTDELLQSALKRYLMKGEVQLREQLTFNDRIRRGDA